MNELYYMCMSVGWYIGRMVGREVLQNLTATGTGKTPFYNRDTSPALSITVICYHLFVLFHSFGAHTSSAWLEKIGNKKLDPEF